MINPTFRLAFIFSTLFTQVIYAVSPVEPCTFLSTHHQLTIPALTRQILVVHSLEGFKVAITACEKVGSAWKQVFASPFPGVVGKFGLTPAQDKKEGDKKTPMGLYSLGEVFSPQPIAVKMDFKYITSDDKYIDDSNSEYYNTWVTGPTNARHENMSDSDLYKLGVIINYNINPVTKGAGSAIFIHTWNSFDRYTTGCVALDENNLLSIVRWLDKKQHPYIYITN